jgi:para-nitrobenzyl esterase
VGTSALGHRPSRTVQHRGEAVDAWYGLRYAQARRFGPPAPASGRLDAERLARVPIFPQRPSRLSAAMGHGEPNPQSEDAFFANVWAPRDAEGLPVLLFLHGGAWMTGGGSMPWCDGGALAAAGLVVVTVNYRLGALGHLGSSDADPLPLPAADALLALQWTVQNVPAFGGDPGRITVAGQSAGGWYGHLLSVLPETRGLVHRVAHLSMGTRQPWSPERQTRVTAAAGAHAGERGLAGAPVESVLAAGLRALGTPDPQLGHAPSGFLPVASAGLPEDLLDARWSAGACHAEAVYLRWTADESAMFFFKDDAHAQATQPQVDEALGSWDPADLPAGLRSGESYAGAASGLSPYRQLVAASSWRQFQRFPSDYAAELRARGRDTTVEVFSEESPLEGLHSGHCFDLPFQFGIREAWKDAPMLHDIDADRFAEVSAELVSGLAGFASA